jgi:pyruvate formate lyase activating enzyme
MKEAAYYKRLNENKIRCDLCPHHCLINAGKTGNCRVRKNIDGTLYSLVYNKPISANVDPIEKKPLFHFYPGSTAFSIATIGCNMQCKHCQNADISQTSVERYPTKEMSPKEIVSKAKKSGAHSIAYTYTEPTIYYEYAYDTAKLAHDEGLKNVFVTNGYIEHDPLKDIAPFLDAANVDLKGMTNEFYTKICGAKLSPVLESIRLYYELGIWLEITTLIIPELNDGEKMLTDIAEYIADLDPNIPWHVTGFYPTYQLTDKPPTPISSLQKAMEIGKSAGLKYMYQGNRGTGENTLCPNCKKELITRSGFTISKNIILNGRCPYCNTKIAGIHLDTI